MNRDTRLVVEVARADLAIAQLDARRRTLLIASQCSLVAGMLVIIATPFAEPWSQMAAFGFLASTLALVGWRWRLSWRRAALAQARSTLAEASLLSDGARFAHRDVP